MAQLVADGTALRSSLHRYGSSLTGQPWLPIAPTAWEGERRTTDWPNGTRTPNQASTLEATLDD